MTPQRKIVCRLVSLIKKIHRIRSIYLISNIKTIMNVYGKDEFYLNNLEAPVRL